MNAKARATRQILKARSRTTRAAARIARRGTASLSTHAMAAGLGPKQARTVAGSLRRNIAKLGLAGVPSRTRACRRMRDGFRYTASQVASAALAYRPRIPAYKAAAAALRLAA